jgi:hypothetical protein
MSQDITCIKSECKESIYSDDSTESMKLKQLTN